MGVRKEEHHAENETAVNTSICFILLFVSTLLVVFIIRAIDDFTSKVTTRLNGCFFVNGRLFPIDGSN